MSNNGARKRFEDRLDRLEQGQADSLVKQAEALVELRHIREKVDERTAASDEWRAGIQKMLTGDGSEQQTGLDKRVDRLENARQSDRRILGALGALLLPVLIQAILAAVRAFHS